ncbi:hypothetical protein BOW53_09585 [Solemya pervernicosa gill symbiont]|uniref:LPS-assembly protein LptD n=1 Tax=Solemya pervernicosa gill symbiont TaxID=642797 RepID=A0A1T2L4H2_9GAMM|nr:hypothetical protein BOW53_09585 [Solemya pervernicosa gill symbiont]
MPIAPFKSTPIPSPIDVTATAKSLLPITAPYPVENFSNCEPMQDVVVDPNAPTRRDAPLEIVAEASTRDSGSVTQFEGNVRIRRSDQYLEAQQARYEQQQELFEAVGDVRFREPGIDVSSETARIELNTNRSVLTGSEYRLPQSHARGSSTRLIREGSAKTLLEDFSYTTCNADRNSWKLRAAEAELDHLEGKGTAKHVRLHVKDIPVLYVPYLSFPIDDRRKSGLLAPSFSSSNVNGFDLSIPYYWNIAPNQDMTITPRYLEKRGTILGLEHRHIDRQGSSDLQFEYLHRDKLYNDQRGLIQFRQQRSLSDNWAMEIDFNHLSDDTYLKEVGSGLSVSSQTHMLRRAEVSYTGDYVQLLARADAYQPLSGNEPYQRLPQLRLDAITPKGPAGLYAGIDSELVRFAHEEQTPTGTRLDLWPRVGMDLEGASYFLRPALSNRFTGYRLDDVTPGDSESPTRNTPLFSLDGGLIFERDAGESTHTLEPRIYYLKVNDEQQDELPVFDTNRPEFGFDQLFSENRFNGADRMGDANQLTLALTTRSIDNQNGHEPFTLSLGQIFYFEDREVTLPGETIEQNNQSDFVAALDWRSRSGLSLNSALRWNNQQDEIDRGTVQLHYQPQQDKIINLSYRYLRDELEQTDVSLLWPLGRRWHLLGRWNYSLLHEHTLETVAGIEYDSCCWAMRLAVRRFTQDITSEYNDSIMLQVELKGLSSVGDNIESLLEDGILGYSRDNSRYIDER